MSYIQGIDRNQFMFFPENFDDYVSEDNPVRFIDAYVDKLDLVQLGFSHATPNLRGRNPYHPGDLLKLYIYGYLNKLRSSRQLEKATYRNIELIWLMRKLHPDFKTIADFRKNNTKAIKKVYREFLLLCKKLGLFGGELIAIDGSKFSANNHNSRSYSLKKLERMVKEIDEKIDAYLNILEQKDQADKEVETVSADDLEDKIKNLESHKRELEELQRTLEQSGQTQISITDPDSRLMKSSRNGTDVSYNVQIVTDSKHKLIVAHEVTNDLNDKHQLANMAIKAKEILGVDTIDATADMDYFEKEEIKQCEDLNIRCYLSTPQKSQNKKLGLYTNQDFRYDAQNDCYICPAKQKLTFRFQAPRSGKEYKIYESHACRTCTLRSKCTRSKHNNRRIYRWVHEEVIEKMQKRVLTNPETVKKRKELVEHPFGTIKHWMGHKAFLMRGQENVSAEMSLTALAYNLKRVFNIIGVKELIKSLA